MVRTISANRMISRIDWPIARGPPSAEAKPRYLGPNVSDWFPEGMGVHRSIRLLSGRTMGKKNEEFDQVESGVRVSDLRRLAARCFADTGSESG